MEKIKNIWLSTLQTYLDRLLKRGYENTSLRKRFNEVKEEKNVTEKQRVEADTKWRKLLHEKQDILRKNDLAKEQLAEASRKIREMKKDNENLQGTLQQERDMSLDAQQAISRSLLLEKKYQKDIDKLEGDVKKLKEMLKTRDEKITELNEAHKGKRPKFEGDDVDNVDDGASYKSDISREGTDMPWSSEEMQTHLNHRTWSHNAELKEQLFDLQRELDWERKELAKEREKVEFERQMHLVQKEKVFIDGFEAGRNEIRRSKLNMLVDSVETSQNVYREKLQLLLEGDNAAKEKGLSLDRLAAEAPEVAVQSEQSSEVVNPFDQDELRVQQKYPVLPFHFPWPCGQPQQPLTTHGYWLHGSAYGQVTSAFDLFEGSQHFYAPQAETVYEETQNADNVDGQIDPPPERQLTDVEEAEKYWKAEGADISGKKWQDGREAWGAEPQPGCVCDPPRDAYIMGNWIADEPHWPPAVPLDEAFARRVEDSQYDAVRVSTSHESDENALDEERAVASLNQMDETERKKAITLKAEYEKGRRFLRTNHEHANGPGWKEFEDVKKSILKGTYQTVQGEAVICSVDNVYVNGVYENKKGCERLPPSVLGCDKRTWTLNRVHKVVREDGTTGFEYVDLSEAKNKFIALPDVSFRGSIDQNEEEELGPAVYASDPFDEKEIGTICVAWVMDNEKPFRWDPKMNMERANNKVVLQIWPLIWMSEEKARQGYAVRSESDKKQWQKDQAWGKQHGWYRHETRFSSGNDHHSYYGDVHVHVYQK